MIIIRNLTINKFNFMVKLFKIIIEISPIIAQYLAPFGDGIFKAKLTYLEAEQGKDVAFEFGGRQFTLKGSAEDKNATILQFVPFNNQEETMNFIYQDNKLIMLDKDMRKIQSKLNYTLIEKE